MTQIKVWWGHTIKARDITNIIYTFMVRKNKEKRNTRIAGRTAVV